MMTDQTSKLEIEQRLEELKDVPARKPGQAARGRANFLNKAAKYQQAVSPATNVRQSGWTFLTNRKEKFAMNALVSLILAGALILGGGATAVAAQDDLPDQPLYQVKLWTENATLALTGDPQQQANLLMQMSQTRVDEMAALAEAGISAPDQVRDRLQDQIHQTLVLASNMDDADLTQTLLQLRDRLQTQDSIMDQLHATAETEPLLTQTRLMLQTRLQLVDQALADPKGFRYMMANQMQYGQDEEVTPEPNQQGEPGFHQNNQDEKPQVVPGSGNGNGNGQNFDNSQNGNGPGNEAPGDPNPQNQQNNNSGSGSGNEAPAGPNLQSPQNDNGGNSSGSNGEGGSGGNK
jgi:Domain of unknown function (DUF5667)